MQEVQKLIGYISYGVLDDVRAWYVSVQIAGVSVFQNEKRTDPLWTTTDPSTEVNKIKLAIE